MIEKVDESIYLKVPDYILLEFKTKWNNLNKCSLYEYHEAVFNWKDNQWFVDLNHIKSSYDSYIDGKIGFRHPDGLRYYPDQILQDILNEKLNRSGQDT